MILTHIYASVRENHGELRTSRSTRATRSWTRNLLSTSLEGRTARPLIGPSCGIKANSPHVGPVPAGECPPWGSFWEIVARIYESIGENQDKFQTARSTSATGYWTRHLSYTSFENRTTRPLVGLQEEREIVSRIIFTRQFKFYNDFMWFIQADSALKWMIEGCNIPWTCVD